MSEKNNVEQKSVDYNILNYLRENTSLSPIEVLKVKREQITAENNRKFYMKYEPSDLIEADYTVADQLEYNLRLKAFKHSVEKLWLEYGDGQDFDEFVITMIKENMNNYSPKNK